MIITMTSEESLEFKRLLTLGKITQKDYNSMCKFIWLYLDSKYVPNSSCGICIGNAVKRLNNWNKIIEIKIQDDSNTSK